MDTLKVSCGLIFKDEKVLICRRKPEKSIGGFWEFPGGKVEDSESYVECLQRELLEELGMEVDRIKYFMTVNHDYKTFTIELNSFICKFKSAEFILIDHDKYEWVKVNELSNWKLAPADRPIAKALSTKLS